MVAMSASSLFAFDDVAATLQELSNKVPEKVVPAFDDVFRRYRRSAGETFWDGKAESPSVKGPKLAEGTKNRRRSQETKDSAASKPRRRIKAQGKSTKKRVADTNVVEQHIVPPLITVFSAPNYRGEDRNLGGVLRINDDSVLLQRFTETEDERSQHKPALAADEEAQRRFEELIPYMPFTYDDMLQACRALEKQQRQRQQLLGEIVGTARHRAVSMTVTCSSSEIATALEAARKISASLPSSPAVDASGKVYSLKDSPKSESVPSFAKLTTSLETLTGSKDSNSASQNSPQAASTTDNTTPKVSTSIEGNGDGPRRRAGLVPRYVRRRQSMDGRISFAKAVGKVRTLRRATSNGKIRLHSSKTTPGRDRLSNLALSRGSVETATSMPLLSSLMKPDGSATIRSRLSPSNSSSATPSNAELLANARRRSLGVEEGPPDSTPEFRPVLRNRSPTMPGRASTMPTLRSVLGRGGPQRPTPPRRHSSTATDSTSASSPNKAPADGGTTDSAVPPHISLPSTGNESSGVVTPASIPDDDEPEPTTNPEFEERFAKISNFDIDRAALKVCRHGIYERKNACLILRCGCCFWQADMKFTKDELHVLKMCFLTLDRDCNAELDKVDIYGFGVDTPGDPCEDEVQEILKAMGGKEAVICRFSRTNMNAKE